MVRGDESGQAFVEYIIVIAVVLSCYLLAVNFLNGFGLAQKLASPIQGDFARAYQYGKTDVKGFETGGPSDHPRVTSAGNNRMFINPTQPQ